VSHFSGKKTAKIKNGETILFFARAGFFFLKKKEVNSLSERLKIDF
jgi:hypothetical protein